MTADLVPLYEEHTELELNSNWESQRCLERTQKWRETIPCPSFTGFVPLWTQPGVFFWMDPSEIQAVSCPPSLPGVSARRVLLAQNFEHSPNHSLPAKLSQLDQAWNYRGPCSPDWFHLNHVRELLNSPVNTLVRMGMGRTHYPANRF